MAKAGKKVRCVIVTPERTVLDETTDFVALPLYDGEMGVLLDHAPLIAELGYGELRLAAGETIHRYYVDGGFLQIRDNVVTLLTSHAVPAGQIDVAVAEESLRAARTQLPTTDEAFAARDRALRRARAQLALAGKGGEED